MVMNWLWQSGAFVVSVALGVVFAGLVLVAAHVPVYDTCQAVIDGALGSVDAFEGSLLYAVPIAFTGLAAAIAFRAQVWNIGGEGQMAMGAFGAALVALWVPLPDPILLPAAVAGGVVCGAAWGFVPAALKIWFGVNEVLSSLFLNYIAILWIDFLVYGPWRDPSGGWPYTVSFPDAARLPPLGTELDIGVIAAPLLGLLLLVLLRFSRWGFALTVVGFSHRAARYAAISVDRITLQVMVLSGGVAALAGVEAVCGSAGRLYHLSPGYGYLGILVSWLGGHNPLLVLFMAVFYGILLQGGAAPEVAQIDPSLVRVVQAAIILFALAGLTLARRFGRRQVKQA